MSATAVAARPDPPAPTPVPDDPPTVGFWQQAITVTIVFAPVIGVLFAVQRFWGHGVGVRDLLLAAVLYAIAGHGVTVGYHRLLTHRGFVASRPLKVALAVAGSLAFEGGPIPWVENHRRHHSFSDREGDPHSPIAFGSAGGGRLKGLWHAHMGWLFAPPQPGLERCATDLSADHDLVVINRLFPLWCVLSLALPFAAGWLLGGTLGAALTALLWAGAVRIFVLHHVTWSINSLCHMYGRRPFPTQDHSTNLAWLSILSFGESWHNGHHAFPRGARHGLLRGQWDSSATLIRSFERAGWATDVHWTKRPGRGGLTAVAARSRTGDEEPTDRVAARRRPPAPGASGRPAGAVREADRQAFVAALAESTTAASPAGRLCEACRTVLGVTGVGISLTTGQHRGQLCVTDAVTSTLEELQYTLGEGPSLDASVSGHPVADPDLGARGPPRWPAFAAAAAAAGIGAVFAFPLRVGAARIGSLTLYQAAPGALAPDLHAMALVGADLVTLQVVALQAGAVPGALADELEAAGLQRAQVHQASGMISVQLGISLGEALIRLRGHAYAVDRPVGEVAADVVGRRLRLDR